MKKILAIIVCTVLLVCAFPITAFAEGDSVDGIEPSMEDVVTTPTEEETSTEEEISSDTVMPDITTDDIVEYIKSHFEEISVMVTLLLTAFYNIRKHKLLNKAISATNKNAIAVSENSEQTISVALKTIEEQKKEFSALLTEYRESEEEKKKLKVVLDEAMHHINAAKLANVEFSNELAELLVLANIPNSKKDELYSRHVAAVDVIAEADKAEVITNDHGEEA